MQAKKGTWEKWEQLLKEMRTSGQTQRIWCTENGISYSTMRGWSHKISPKKRKSEIEAPTVKWLPVCGVQEVYSAKDTTSKIKIQIGAFTIEISEHFNQVIFKEICKALKELC